MVYEHLDKRISIKRFYKIVKDSLDWFEEGTGLYDEGNYRGAITAFDRAIALDPSLVDAWNNRGISLIQMGRDQEALRSIEQALSLNPRHENALKTRELLLGLMGDNGDAGGKQGSGHNDPVSPRDTPDPDNVQSRPGPINPVMQRYVPPTPPRSNPPSPGSASPGQVPPNPAPIKPVQQRPVPSAETKKDRYPILAVLFSLLFPGWGQWYNGQRWDGLKFLAAVILLGIVNLALFVILKRNLIVSGIFTVLGFGIWIYGMYDAYTTAEKINRGEIRFERKSRLFWLPVIMVALMVALLVLAGGLALVFALAGVASHSTGTYGTGGIPASAGTYGSMADIQHIKVVAATAQQPDSGTIIVTYQGGQDANQLSQVVVTVMDAAGNSQTKTLGQPGDTAPPEVGSSMTFTGTFLGKDHVVATAKFRDGSEQVILDSMI